MSISGDFYREPVGPRREPGRRGLPLTPDEATVVAAALLVALERADDAAEAATLRAVLERLTHP